METVPHQLRDICPVPSGRGTRATLQRAPGPRSTRQSKRRSRRPRRRSPPDPSRIPPDPAGSRRSRIPPDPAGSQPDPTRSGIHRQPDPAGSRRIPWVPLRLSRGPLGPSWGSLGLASGPLGHLKGLSWAVEGLSPSGSPLGQLGAEAFTSGPCPARPLLRREMDG